MTELITLNFLSSVLSSISAFLMVPPVSYITGMILVLFVIAVIKKLIGV